jgi:hypothetical protein
MIDEQRFVDEDVVGRQYEYDGRTTLVADFGASVDGSVDLVGDTAIVVVGDDQYEFEVPAGVVVRASMNNGVLTVEVERRDAETEAENEDESVSESENQTEREP